VAVAAWFKDQVLRVMQNEGMKKIETTRFRATVAMPGGKAAMEIVDAIPNDWHKTVTEVVIDKERIRAALDGGDVLPFARLVEKQPYLRIS
jgi:glycerate-2-kinase